jgi:dihydroorotate dehydrogenase (NAD+) catalytic subunit
MNSPDLSVKIADLTLKNPVTVASGTYGYGTEYADFYDPALLGGIFLKGLTLEVRQGNPPQRLVETPSGLMNAIGLQNVGYDLFVKEKLPKIQDMDTAMLANVCGASLDDYIGLAEKLAHIPRIDGIELNISCPNVNHGGMAFGCSTASAAEVTTEVRKVYPGPMIVKLSPNVTDITPIARSVEDAGADAIAVSNTFVGLAIDIETRRPKLGNITGGLSGPAIRPMALRLVWQCAQAVNIPIIGQGGITDWQDAIEFFIAGASAISIGTANFTNPTAPIEIIDGIRHYLQRHECDSLNDIVGTLKL